MSEAWSLVSPAAANHTVAEQALKERKEKPERRSLFSPKAVERTFSKRAGQVSADEEKKGDDNA